MLTAETGGKVEINDTDDPVFRMLTLERVRMRVEKLIDRGLMVPQNLKLEFADVIARGLVGSLEVDFLAKHVRHEEFGQQTPMDWWEALKERWFPLWMIRRFPVRRRKITVEKNTWYVCPHLPYEAEEGNIVQIPIATHVYWLDSQVVAPRGEEVKDVDRP